MVKDFAQLLIEIEKLRSEMHWLATMKGLNHEEVVLVSQQLDNLLNKYYKIKRQKATTPRNNAVLYTFKPKEFKLTSNICYTDGYDHLYIRVAKG